MACCAVQAIEDLIAAACAEDDDLPEDELQVQQPVVVTANPSTPGDWQPSSSQQPQPALAEVASQPAEASREAASSPDVADQTPGLADDARDPPPSGAMIRSHQHPQAQPVKSGKPVAKHKGADKGTGRNQRCSCGSHKKFKNCCGAARNRAASDTVSDQQQQQLDVSASPLFV